MMSVEVFLARRYLGARHGRGLSVITWIALAGIMVGVMSLVTVLAVMSGFEKELRSLILGNNAHILAQLDPFRSWTSHEQESLLQKVKLLKGISSAMPVIYGEGFILSPSGASEGVVLKGVPLQQLHDVLDLDRYVLKKAWSDFEGQHAILGEALARRLHLDIGNRFTLVLNRGEFSPIGLVPRMKKFIVSDLFHSGMTQYDSRHGYLPLQTAKEVFETEPTAIEIRVKNLREIQEIKKRIRQSIPEIVQVDDWLSLNQDFLSALRLEKTAMAVVLALIILVAAFNICGSLIMIVRDKAKDIAILKSMGASDACVLKIFFLQGLFIGAVGTIMGVIGGMVLSILLRDYIHFPLNKEVYMIDTLPVDLRITDIVFVAIGAMVISSLATYYPSRLAAKMVPTEGLKAD